MKAIGASPPSVASRNAAARASAIAAAYSAGSPVSRASPRPMPKPVSGAITRPTSIAALCFRRAETAVVATKSGTATAIRRAKDASGRHSGGQLVQGVLEPLGEDDEVGDRVGVGANADRHPAAERVGAQP